MMSAKLQYVHNLPEVSNAVGQCASEEAEIIAQMAVLETRLAEVRARCSALVRSGWTKDEIAAAKAFA